MPINTIATAQKYTDELDKMFVQKSVTGFFADNNFRAKFVGAKTVIMPDVDFQGLVNYDKDNGFTRGAVTVAQTPYTLSMDRARSFQIDREDMDETGIASLAGKILGEFVRIKVVPECDAYMLSKLAGIANTKTHKISGAIQNPYEKLNTLINNVQAVVGYDEELVAFISGGVNAALMNSAEITRQLTVSDFKKGEITTKVKKLNDVAILPVSDSRMKSLYTFAASGEGGFAPAEGAKDIHAIVIPKRGAHLVRKSETLRIFTPDKNVDADAYKFDYRLYYDGFVKKSETDAIWAWLSA